MEGRPDLLRASPSRIWMGRISRDQAMQQLDGLQEKWLSAVAGAGGLEQLEALRVEALGKKGEVTGLMKTLGGLSPEERKEAGQRLNQLKDALTNAIDARKAALE